jgi:glycosyltransferase involved in cell wall biosynthesis
MDVNISVIIPTFNRAHLIAETIESIINQSFKPREIIVIDDGSTDNTDRVIAKYRDVVQYYKIENSGVCTARNLGADKAGSEWLAFCDSDDLWHRDKLLLQVELVRSAPEIEYCFTNFQIYKNGQ